MNPQIRVEVRQNRIPKVTREMETQIVELIDKAAFDISAHAKTKVPVDTGALKNSIAVTPGEDRFSRYVIAPKFYAPYVEFGTRKMAPRPYLGPAVATVQPVLISALRQLGLRVGKK